MGADELALAKSAREWYYGVVHFLQEGKMPTMQVNLRRIALAGISLQSRPAQAGYLLQRRPTAGGRVIHIMPFLALICLLEAGPRPGEDLVCPSCAECGSLK